MENNDTGKSIITEQFTRKQTKFFKGLKYEDLLEVEGDKRLLLRNRNFIDKIKLAESDIDLEQSEYLKNLFSFLCSNKPIAIDEELDNFKVEKIFSYKKKQNSRKQNSDHELVGYGIIEEGKKYAIRLEPRQEGEALRRFCLYQENLEEKLVKVNDIFNSDSHCKSVFERFVRKVAQINEKQNKLAPETLNKIDEFIINSEKKKVADEEVMRLTNELKDVEINKALEELLDETKNAQINQDSVSMPNNSVHQAKIDNLVQSNVETIPSAVLLLGPEVNKKEYSIAYTYTPQGDQNQSFDEAVIKIFIGCANHINKKFSDADKPTKEMSDFISLVKKIRQWGGANYMINDRNEKVPNTESKNWEKEFSAKFQLETENIIQLKVGEREINKMFLYAIPDAICEKLQNDVTKKDDGLFEYRSNMRVSQEERGRS